MSRARPTIPPLRVAVPVLDGRVLPRFGQAQEFVVASVDRSTARVHRLETCSWDAAPGAVGGWLRGLGVDWVLCGGIHPRFLVALEAEGLRVVWGQRGPVEEVLQSWARGEAPVPASPAPGGPEGLRRG